MTKFKATYRRFFKIQSLDQVQVDGCIQIVCLIHITKISPNILVQDQRFLRTLETRKRNGFVNVRFQSKISQPMR